MEDNINSIIELALVGGLLAVFVLWIFLRNIRLVLVIGLAIPISIYTAFNFFYAFDISINSLTLVGMALAIGMLLDNSVVVLENIYRQATLQESFDKAVLIGTREVWRSVFAATLTTVTVFLPFIFSTNYMIKVMGNHIGVSIISTLTVSLFVALLLIPMVTHFFMAKSAGNKALFEKVSVRNRMIQIYILFLKFSMRYPTRTLVGAMVLFFVTILGSIATSVDTLEEVESNELVLYVTMPGGSSLEATDFLVQEVENRLENIEEKQDVISRIEEEDAILTVVMKEDFEAINGRSMADVKTMIEKGIANIQNAEIGFEQPRSSQRFRGPGGGGPAGKSASFQRMMGIGSQQERIEIMGQDFDKMQNVAEDIQYYLEEMESIRSVSLNVSDNRPEVHMDFDVQLMAEFGIPLTSVASELNSFQSEISSGSVFKQGTESYDIIIKNYTEEEDERKNMQDLKLMQIPDENEVNRELQVISNIFYATGMRNINRVNQEKQIELTYRFEQDINESKTMLEAARLEIDDIVASLSLPSGVAVEIIHEESDLDEYYLLIAAAFILIYMILASVFESFTSPIVLMFSIPLAAIGSFAALIITNNSLFNANTLTGFLILLGVVVNNGIILIDYTNLLQKQGFRQSRALIVAGMARVRPILITAITTIVALLPLALGESEYVGSIGAPFAITVIGGLMFSTIFTLIFIPTFYSGLNSAISWFRKLDWVILIPGITYFLLTSLKQATDSLVPDNKDLKIKIQSLVKVYDRDSRFVREWKSGNMINARLDDVRKASLSAVWPQLIWQVPLIAFLVYFSYFYLNSPFWSFFVSICIFFLVLFVLNSLISSAVKNRALAVIKKLAYWGLPMANLIIFQIQWDNLAAVIVIGIAWYLLLAIHTTSSILFDKKININRLKGKFARIRRGFFSFVQSIPLIGKKKEPFRALDNVTLNIGQGMFGLLGPNGAGKTTLMRIICGILEQSYGKIWIGGFDSMQKREELQGLIGYLPQAFGTYEHMSAWEFLNYQAMLKNIIDKEERESRIKKCLKEVNMHEHMHEKIGSFSGGMKQRIGIAQILLHLPKILVVDEPTAGLDPRERIRFRNLLVELSKNRIVIFSTHIIEDISSSCNNMAVLNRGKLKYHGNPQEMTKTAEGKVWQFDVPASQFDALNEKLLIVHHMRDENNIKVRCIAGSKPYDSAMNVRPNLEDAYLWLIKGDSL
jgi:ABC-type multidrug transport system ATPase subunit/predicted RND superfamily exporter protein